MEINITGEYIKLDQLLKFSNLVESGSNAKEIILSGLVLVDGTVETRRGRKIYKGMKVQFNNESVIVK